MPDCGAGCRVVINGPIDHPPYFTFQYSKDGVSETGGNVVYYQPFDAVATAVIDSDYFEPASFLQSSPHDGHVLYDHPRHSVDAPYDDIVLSDLSGSSKSNLFHSEKLPGSSKGGILEVALTSAFAFVHVDFEPGLYRIALADGSVENFPALPNYCSRVCAGDDFVLCSNGRLWRIDAATATATLFAPTKALQNEASCSPDRTKYAWVDYRDPPGDTSTDVVIGGEIYVSNLTDGTVERVTFDSPNAPTPKANAAVDGDLVAWAETKDGVQTTPTFLTDIFLQMNTLVVLDRAKKTRCRLTDWPLIRPFFVRGREIMGEWFDHATDASWFVALNVDTPGLPWTCQPVPLLRTLGSVPQSGARRMPTAPRAILTCAAAAAVLAISVPALGQVPVDEEMARLRVPGRITIGPSLHYLAPVGYGVGLRFGIQVSQGAIVEATASGGVATNLCSSRACGVGSLELSALLLPMDTFYLRVGAGVRSIRQDVEQSGEEWADHDVGVVVGIGNRWDWRRGYVSIGWLGMYIPVVPIAEPERLPSGASGSRHPVEVRLVTASWGIAF